MKKFLFLLFLAIPGVAAAQPGAIDLSFGTTDLGFGFGDGTNGQVLATAIQSDGKTIIGGQFTTYNSTARNNISRLNVDGTLDGTFTQGTGANGDVNVIVIQSDGKIIIGGNFSLYNGTPRNAIARLNADGTLDGTFDPGTGANGRVKTSAIQTDGKIIIGGGFSVFNGTSRNGIARLNTNGGLDGTFDPGTGVGTGIVNTSAIQSDGKIIIGGQFSNYNGTSRNGIARITVSGSLDAGFDPGTGANNILNTCTLQSDGKIIIAGEFSTYNGTSRNGIARTNANGSLDGTFDPGTGVNNRIFASAIQPDGKILIWGQFTTYNSTARSGIARLNSNGGLDGTLNPGTGVNNAAQTGALQSDGKIIVGGFFSAYNGITKANIARVNSDGTLDVTFNQGTGASNAVQAIAIQPDGKVIVGGQFTVFNGVPRNRVVRLNADGTSDPSFDPGSGANNTVSTASIQTDGKVIIGGSFTTYGGSARNNIARLNTNGTLDGTFDPGTGTNGTVNVVAIQSDGKIIIGGSFTLYNATARNNIARLNTDGTLDGTFNPGTGASASVNTIALQSDGKIIIGGQFMLYNGTARIRIARLNADGNLDGTFTPGAGANGPVWTSLIQSDGKIFIGGSFTSYNSTSRNNIARLNTDGTLDGTFGAGLGTNQAVQTSALGLDGRIIIAGQFTSCFGTSRVRIARLNADGTPEVTFDPGAGASNTIWSSAVQSDGRLIVGGDFISYNGTGRNRIARILTGTLPGQTITFGPLPTKTYNNAPFLLAATASSGLPVTYVSSNPAVATVSGNTLTIEGAGTCTITAKQAGNGSFAAAPDVPQTLTVNKANQTLTTNFLGTPRLTTDGAYSPQAFYSSGLPPTITSSNPAVATVSGTQITPGGAGTTTLTVSQSGDNNFNAATNSNVSLTVNNPALSPYKFVLQGGAPVSQLTFAVSNIEVDATGKIYVPNPGLAQVIVLNADGSFNLVFGSFGINDGELNAPSDVAVDGSGDIYVVDAGNHRIQVFGPTGNYIRKFGSIGAGSGRLFSPNSIALDGNGNVFITERTTGRVSVFTTAGVFQYAFGSAGAGDGQLSIPRGIELDGAGKVYVVDAGNGRVVVYGTTGNFIRNIGSNGAANGQLNAPKYVKVDGAGNVIVTNDANARVEVFDPNGNFLTNFPWPGGLGGACGIARDPGGNFYISNYNTNQLLKFSAAGAFLQSIMPLAQDVLQLFQPSGVAFDAAGNVYVGSASSDVRVYSPTGTYIRTIGSPGTGDGQFSGSPGKIAVDATGNTYVVDIGNNRVQVFDNTGAFVRKIGVGLLSTPVGLGLDAAGRIYVTDQGNDNIQVFQNNGTFITSFGSVGTGNGQFNNPSGVAVDATGKIYVADFANNRIQVFATTFTFLQAFGSAGGGNGQFQGPFDIKLDAAGRIYVADRNNRRIQVFQNDGTFLYNVGSLGYGPQAGNGRMWSPVSLAVNPSGLNIGVADAENNLVHGFGSPDINLKQAAVSIPAAGNFDFGNVNMLSSSTALTFTIENLGSAPLSLPGTPKVVVSGTHASDFVANVTATSATVAAAATTTFTVTFTPSSSGIRNAQLSIVSDDLEETPYLVNVQGTGVKLNQTITFSALAPKNFGDANFNLTATASSTLLVTYVSSNPAVATISGTTVTVVGVGTTTITASQAGNGNYNAAVDVPQVLTVNKANQTITFGALTAKTFGDPSFALAGTSSSGLAVSYLSSDLAVATISGNMVTIVGAGTSTITASQGGNANYNAAVAVPQTLTVSKASQTITFNSLPTVGVADPPFALTATASSGLAVTYTSSTPSVATVSGNTVTIVSGGTTTITASQAGNANYNPAIPVNQSLTVKQSQTIAFGSLPPKTFGDAAFALSATASSALAVSYTSSNPAVATVAGITVTIVGAGTTVITASQAGNATFLAAADVPQTLTVAKANQTITFGAIAAKTMGDAPFTLTGTASSGLALQYTSTATSKLTIAGNQATIVGPGSVTIQADQSGNTNFNAAPQVSQTFCINPAKPVITLNGANTESPTLTSSSSTGNQWFKDGAAIAGATGTSLPVAGAGVYTVQVTVEGCASEMSAQQALVVTGDLKAKEELNLIVFPNPVRDELQLDFMGFDRRQPIEVVIYDLSGRVMGRLLGTGHARSVIDVRSYSTGSYIIKAIQAETVVQKQFIKH